eukprot:3294297-Amphidinium_carterae.1
MHCIVCHNCQHASSEGFAAMIKLVKSLKLTSVYHRAKSVNMPNAETVFKSTLLFLQVKASLPAGVHMHASMKDCIRHSYSSTTAKFWQPTSMGQANENNTKLTTVLRSSSSNV